MLTQSLGGVDVPMITISNKLNDHNCQSDKKYVFITARVHPGETNSSYMLHGLIKFLLSTNKVANLLRDRIIFKIVPMLNPDGVIVGNNRASFTGKDMNRCYNQYTDANSRLNPELTQVRELIKKVISQEQSCGIQGSDRLLGFFDLHQHSGRKSIFMYAPYFPLHSRRYLKIRMMPKLLSETSEAFRYYSCKFRAEPSKEGSARLAFAKDFNLENSFTVEISALGFLNANRETVPFD